MMNKNSQQQISRIKFRKKVNILCLILYCKHAEAFTENKINYTKLLRQSESVQSGSREDIFLRFMNDSVGSQKYVKFTILYVFNPTIMAMSIYRKR